MARNRILVVDDDIRIVELLKAYLEADDFEVCTALNGKEALEQFNLVKPDLVLLDIMMPEQDGLSVCREIRRHDTTPIIFLSAKGDEIDKVVGLEVGADDYITKPFSHRELIARVKANIRRDQLVERKIQQSPLTFGDLSIDPIQRVVTARGSVVDLAPKEFDLLLFLANHPNQVFKREQIYEKVWGYDYYGGLRTVDVHITRLRNKVEVNPSNPKYLVTVWGVGYKFAAPDN